MQECRVLYKLWHWVAWSIIFNTKTQNISVSTHRVWPSAQETKMNLKRMPNQNGGSFSYLQVSFPAIALSPCGKNTNKDLPRKQWSPIYHAAPQEELSSKTEWKEPKRCSDIHKTCLDTDVSWCGFADHTSGPFLRKSSVASFLYVSQSDKNVAIQKDSARPQSSIALDKVGKWIGSGLLMPSVGLIVRVYTVETRASTAKLLKWTC